MQNHQKHLILDSSNLLYRLFWAWDSKGESLTEDEDDVTIVYTFLNCLKSYVNRYKPSYIYAVWDHKLEWPSTNFRKDAADVDYKGQRDHTKTAKLHDKDRLIQEMLTLLGVRNMFPRVMEADDVIGWLCKQLDEKIVIVSNDQDMWQLIDKDVSVFTPIKKCHIDKTNFQDFSPVSTEFFLRYKSFLGDVSDNITGVKGIGKARAQKLLENWEQNKHGLSSEQFNILHRNLELMDLSYGYTVHDGEEESYKTQFKVQQKIEPNFSKFEQKCEELDLYAITSKISIWSELFGKQILTSNINNLIERLGLNK